MTPKVLMFGWEFPPHNSGGLGVACQGIIDGLATHDAEVHFVLPRTLETADSPAEFHFADISVPVTVETIQTLVRPYDTDESYRKRRSKTGDPEGIHYGNTLLAEVQRYAHAAGDIARRVEHDVIHAHDWLSFLAGIEASRVSGKPFVAHVHATEYDRTGGGDPNPAVHAIETKGLAAADRVLTVSGLTRDIVVREYGVNPDKVRVAHNGVSLREFQPLPLALEHLKEQGKKIVLFLGRKTIQKGPDHFLRAAKRLCEVRDDVHFVMAGSGDMENQLIEEAAQLGIADKVLFTGFLRGDDIHRMYQTADVYVLSSISEPFGITPLEAMMNKTPVVLSKQSGVAEVLRHALKVDFWDIDEMANKINGLLEHPEMHDHIREQASDEVETISWDKTAKECINCYREIMKV